MNEADTRAELIEPALRAAGWGAVEGSLICREVIAPGRLQGGGGRRSKALACDFVLTDRGRKPADANSIRWPALSNPSCTKPSPANRPPRKAVSTPIPRRTNCGKRKNPEKHPGDAVRE